MSTPEISTENFTGYIISRAMSDNDMNVMNQLVETWVIQKKPFTPTAGVHDIVIPECSHYQLMVTEGVIPKVGSLYSAWATARGWCGDGTFPVVARCRSNNFTTMPDGRISVTTRWSTYYQVDPKSMASLVYQLPCSIEFQGGSREMLVYRIGSTMTSPSFSSDKSTTDIGGDAAIPGGKTGMPSFVPITKIRMRVIKDATIVGIADLAAHIGTFIGMRNSEAFLGFGTKTVVFDNFTVTGLEGEFYEIVFHFTFDRYYEHSQVPVMDFDGQPRTISSGSPAAVNIEDVRWQRVTRDTKNFNHFFFDTYAQLIVGTIFTSQQAIALKGYWVP
jgi:hypothetical protein